jgi:Methyltransferase domain
VSEEPPDEGLVPRFARPALRAGDVTGWFEPVYAGAGDDASAVPWADLAPNPLLVEWLARDGRSGDVARAIVVGCGLGDDLEELRQLGFDVVGFDVAPSAIEWARRRFPDQADRFFVANLLELPKALVGAFAFVFEAYTVQALPDTVRDAAIDGVASLVAPGGTLLVVCSARDEDDDPGSLPWPLTRTQLERFPQNGLREQRFEDLPDAPLRREFRVEYVRS